MISDSVSEDGNEFQARPLPRSHRVPKIRLIIQSAQTHVRSLFDVSPLIRRPRVTDKHLNSIATKSDSAGLQSDPGIFGLTTSFNKHDESHVVEKILQWRGLNKYSQEILFEVEDAVIDGMDSGMDCIQNIQWLCSRLAIASTRRREQLRYWHDHPYDPQRDRLNIFVAPHSEKKGDRLESRSEASTLNL